jgi:hypothetical protein
MDTIPEQAIQTKTKANGAIFDAQTGKIIQAPTVPPFNKPEIRAKAAETKRKRYEMTQNRLLRGMMEKTAAMGLMPPDAPAGEMVQAVGCSMMDVVLNPQEDPRARETVRKGLFQDAGLTPRAYAKDDAPEGGARISIDLSVDTIAAIMQNMADNRAKHE